jgi:hypothetical protein
MPQLGQVLAVCVTDQPLPPDKTPADTRPGKGPKKKMTSSKATFTFSSPLEDRGRRVGVPGGVLRRVVKKKPKR